MKDVTAFIAGLLTCALAMLPLAWLAWWQIFSAADAEQANNSKLARSMVWAIGDTKLPKGAVLHECFIDEKLTKAVCNYSLRGELKAMVIGETK